MLNFENIPGHQISGLGTEELEWVSRESNDRFLKELSDDLISYLNDVEGSSVPQSILDELDQIEMQGIPPSSKSQMENTVRRFTTFLTEKKIVNEFEGHSYCNIKQVNLLQHSYPIELKK